MEIFKDNEVEGDMTERIEVIENGKYCLLKLSSFECVTEMRITDEELFILAASAAKISATRIMRKEYENMEVLGILRKAVQEK